MKSLLKKLFSGFLVGSILLSTLGTGSVFAEEEINLNKESVSLSVRVSEGGSAEVIVGEEKYNVSSVQPIEVSTEKGTDVSVSFYPDEGFTIEGFNAIDNSGNSNYYGNSDLELSNNIVSFSLDRNLVCDVTFNEIEEDINVEDDTSSYEEEELELSGKVEGKEVEEELKHDNITLNNSNGGTAVIEDLDVEGWKLLTVQSDSGKLIEDVVLSDNNIVYYIYDSKADGTYCRFAFREPISHVDVNVTYVDSYDELPMTTFGNAYSPEKKGLVDLDKDSEELSASRVLYGEESVSTYDYKLNSSENKKIADEANALSSFKKSTKTRGNVNYVTGSRISYEGHVTHWMWADDYISYCARPNAPTPPSGTYYMDQYWDNGTLFARFMYNLYGGGYFTKGGVSTLFNQYGWDTKEEQYAYSHIIATLICNNAAAVESDNFSKGSFSSSCWTGMSQASIDRVLNVTHHIVRNYKGATPTGTYSFMIAENTRYQAVLGIWYPESGSVTLKKSSTNPGLTNGNSNYSLAGAVYTVYRDSGLANIAGTLTTDANGNTNTLTLESGTYYVKETSAPKGFNLDPNVHTVTIQAGQTSTVYSSDSPKTGSVGVSKTSANTSITNGNSNYSLQGAVYGVYTDGNCTNEIGRITTDANGNGTLGNLSGGRYYVKELSPSKGYNLDPNIYPVDCTI